MSVRTVPEGAYVGRTTPGGEQAAAATAGVTTQVSGLGAVGADPGTGPTVLRILLGAQLRTLREGRGVTRERAGYAIRGSASKISRRTRCAVAAAVGRWP